mmetsp:Transcript_6127/g.13612  ORF Transcript_6127/g.13612 Transcript_6127/m.13612 type:complete len:564 (-) Transcript_6127:171-1862(-)
MPAPLHKPLLQNDHGGLCDHISKDMGLSVPARAFWIVCATIFIDSLGGSISAPVLPFYAKKFHASNFEVGVAFSIFSFAQVIFLPIMGKLADRWGRRQVLVMSLFGSACGAWAQGLAVSFPMLVTARILSGACGAVGSTANVYVSDITHRSVRCEYLGYLMSSNGAAFAFGPGLGGGLSRFGLNAPVIVNGALCCIAGVIAYFYLPESPVFVRQQEEGIMECDGSPRLKCSPRKRTLPATAYFIFAIEFLRGFSFSAVFAIYGLFADAVYGLDSLHVGFAVCVGALTLISTNIFVTSRLEDVAGHIMSALIGVVMMSFGEVALAYAPYLGLSLLGMWIVYAGQGIAGANIAAITSMLATDENRGEVMSMQQMAQAMGRVVGPMFLGRISEASPRQPFLFSAASTLLAAVVIYSLRHSYKRAVHLQDTPTPAPAEVWNKYVCEEYTQQDVQELGTFLCELLTEGQYKWHKPAQREKLKEMLRLCFPPLDGTVSMTGVQSLSLQAPQCFSDTRAGLASMNMAEVTFTGGDSNFLKSPPGEMRKIFRKGKRTVTDDMITRKPSSPL